MSTSVNDIRIYDPSAAAAANKANDATSTPFPYTHLTLPTKIEA